MFNETLLTIFQLVEALEDIPSFVHLHLQLPVSIHTNVLSPLI